MYLFNLDAFIKRLLKNTKYSILIGFHSNQLVVVVVMIMRVGQEALMSPRSLDPL